MEKLVIAITSDVLFDLNTAIKVGRSSVAFEKGHGFVFIKKMLDLNNIVENETLVEVILLCMNKEKQFDILKSVKYYNLNIARAIFTENQSPKDYISASNVSLFLSSNYEEILEVINLNLAAGKILPTNTSNDLSDNIELRIAFDFDGVIVDDESDVVFEESGCNYEAFFKHEIENALVGQTPGPFFNFFKKIFYIQKIEEKISTTNNSYKKVIRTSIITSRNLHSCERPMRTLKEWDIEVNDIFVMAGQEKSEVLKILKPHLYVDDQLKHLYAKIENVCFLHVPFGIKNNQLFQ